eukprot:9739371-Ditylum_brightwellii.AAC.1
MRMMMKRQGHFQKWRKQIDQQPAYNMIINAEVQLHDLDVCVTYIQNAYLQVQNVGKQARKEF